MFLIKTHKLYRKKKYMKIYPGFRPTHRARRVAGLARPA
jgi:hypothetical protein